MACASLAAVLRPGRADFGQTNVLPPMTLSAAGTLEVDARGSATGCSRRGGLASGYSSKGCLRTESAMFRLRVSDQTSEIQASVPSD